MWIRHGNSLGSRGGCLEMRRDRRMLRKAGILECAGSTTGSGEDERRLLEHRAVLL